MTFPQRSREMTPQNGHKATFSIGCDYGYPRFIITVAVLNYPHSTELYCQSCASYRGMFGIRVKSSHIQPCQVFLIYPGIFQMPLLTFNLLPILRYDDFSYSSFVLNRTYPFGSQRAAGNLSTGMKNVPSLW